MPAGLFGRVPLQPLGKLRGPARSPAAVPARAFAEEAEVLATGFLLKQLPPLLAAAAGRQKMQVAQLGGEVGAPLLAAAAGRPQRQVAQLGGEVGPPLLRTAAGRPQMQVAQLGGEVRPPLLPALLATAPLLSTEMRRGYVGGGKIRAGNALDLATSGGGPATASALGIAVALVTAGAFGICVAVESPAEAPAATTEGSEATVGRSWSSKVAGVGVGAGGGVGAGAGNT